MRLLLLWFVVLPLAVPLEVHNALEIFQLLRTYNGSTRTEVLLRPDNASVRPAVWSASSVAAAFLMQPAGIAGDDSELALIGPDVTASQLHGSPNAPSVIIDWSSMDRASTRLSGTARVTFEHVGLVGSCYRFQAFDAEGQRGWYSNSQAPFFNQDSGDVQRITLRHVIELVSAAEVVALQFLWLLFHLPFPQIPLAVIETWLAVVPRTQGQAGGMSLTTTVISYGLFPNHMYIDRAATSDPRVLGLDPSQVEPRVCNDILGGGRILTQEELSRSPAVTPLWGVTNSSSLQQGLIGVATHESSTPSLPAIMVYNDVMVDSGTPGSPIPTITHLAVMAGACADSDLSLQAQLFKSTEVMPEPAPSTGMAGLPGRPKQPFLDLTNAGEQAIVHVGAPDQASNGTLMLYNVGLRGLLNTQLTALIPAGSTLPVAAASLRTALPLWNFRNPECVTCTQLLMHTVTLVLPQGDYAALVAAVLRGSAWRTGAVQTSVLFLGITQLEAAPWMQYRTNLTTRAMLPAQLKLLSYTGWGVIGSYLVLRPEVPLDLDQPLPDWGLLMDDPPASADARSDDGSGASKHLAIGLGVGLGVGIPLLLLAALMGVLQLRGRHGATSSMGKDVAACAPAAMLSIHVVPGSGLPGAAAGSASSKDASRANPGLTGHVSLWKRLTGGWASHLEGGMRQGSSTAQTGTSYTGHSDTPQTQLGDPNPVRSLCEHGSQLFAHLTSSRAVSGTPQNSNEGKRSAGARTPTQQADANSSGIAKRRDSAMGEGWRDVVESLSARINGEGMEHDNVTLTSVLGKGSWGKVYCGIWRGMEVAVKTVIFSTPHIETPKSISQERPATGSHGSAPHSQQPDEQASQPEATAVVSAQVQHAHEPKQRAQQQGTQQPQQPQQQDKQPHELEVRHAEEAHVPDRSSMRLQTTALAINEAATCMSLNHRNVIATYAYDVKRIRTVQETGQQLVVIEQSPSEEWKLFLIQELCACSLEHALDDGSLHKADGALRDEGLVLWILADVAAGLAHLHSKRIVHGDLKPANVLLKPDAECQAGAVAKLADFGLAAAMDAQATHVSDYRRGTPYWMAPEVLEHARMSMACDVYSLGVLFWTTYTQNEPCLWNKQERMFERNPRFPTFPPGTIPLFAEITHACLAKEPCKRPTAEEVLDAVTRILAKGGVTYAAPVRKDGPKPTDTAVGHNGIAGVNEVRPPSGPAPFFHRAPEQASTE